MRAYTEELFGLVAVVYRVEDDAQAIALANTSAYGLGGAVFSSDAERARAVADQIESGMVWINHPTSSEPNLPFGGIKRAGYGRELSHIGISLLACWYISPAPLGDGTLSRACLAVAAR